MKNIDIMSRIKNKQFWLFFIPTIILIITKVASLFGYQLELDGISEQLVDIVEAVFLLLSAFGVVVDNSTKGLGDSTQTIKKE